MTSGEFAVFACPISFLAIRKQNTEQPSRLIRLHWRYPSWYSPSIASTLNSLGDLYNDTARMTESSEAYTQALQIRRELVKKNWQWYAPSLATTLNSIGSLYARTQRLDEANSFFWGNGKHKLHRTFALASPAGGPRTGNRGGIVSSGWHCGIGKPKSESYVGDRRESKRRGKGKGNAHVRRNRSAMDTPRHEE